ncbi:TIGR02221 family CRISPR-associated protein [Phycisphaerales bacterium]|nr:TIGR02221 family CRISPR-associated protein [Phycisphaerales bacterium]
MTAPPNGDVLVSFLGRSRGGYRSATYRFENGETESARFFGCAAIKVIMRRRHPIQRWVVLGTAGSDWGTIAEGAESKDGSADDAVLEALEELAEPSRQSMVTNDMLAPLEGLISAASGVPEIRLRVVPYGRNDSEAKSLSRSLDEAIAGTSTLHLDVTHGLRHLPVIATVTALGLLWSRNIRLGHLFYGAHELAEDGMTPVLDLATCGEMAADTARLAAHRTTGRYDILADAFPEEIEKLIRSAAFYEAVNRTGEARRPASSAIDSLRMTESDTPIKAALHHAACESMSWSNGAKFVDRLRDRAMQALQRCDWMSTASLTYEAMLLAAARLAGTNPDPLSWNDKERDDAFGWIKSNLRRHQMNVFHQSRILRNAIVHGTRPTGGNAAAVMDALASPEATKEALQRGLDLLDELTRQKDD